MKKVFVSSVQKKFERERAAINSTASDDLLAEVRSSLRDIMLDDGSLSELPFEDQCLGGASLDDIDANRVAWFVERAVRVRKAKYSVNPAVVDVLRSLHLLDAKRNAPTKAGVLLFGRDVQGPFPSSAIKCACYPGTEKRKPNIDMELVEGDLFQMADQAIAFVNRHLNHGAGVHSHGAVAEDVDEMPNSVIAEVVNNAIAHRNYASIGSIQIEVYSDRIEVISPGRLHRAITVADLYKKHESYATNPRIARAMYQVKYIETLGTGLTDLLKECKAKGLRKPLLEEISGRFRVVLWRPGTTSNRGGNRGDNRGTNLLSILPEEQRRICGMLIENPKIAIRKMAVELNIRPRTVDKQIAALKAKGILVRKGGTRGCWEVKVGDERA